MLKKQLNFLASNQTREQIKTIRERFALESDAQAIAYAVNELAQEIEPPVPFNPDAFKIVEDEVYGFVGKARPLHNPPHHPSLIDRICEEATKQYPVARADRAKSVKAVRICLTCNKSLNDCDCPPPAEPMQIPDAQ